MPESKTSTHSLIVGERYVYGFPASPAGVGIYRGMSDFGWLVLECKENSWTDAETVIKFLNLDRMNVLQHKPKGES